MPALAAFLFACTTSYVVAVDLQVYPTDEEMSPMMTPDEVDRANSALKSLGLTSLLTCPMAERIPNKMVTLADGYTYDQGLVVESCRNTDTLVSPHYRHLAIPTSLAFAFVNLDLMDIAKNAESIKKSVASGEIPTVIRPWVGSSLRQPIWICADGRSLLTTSFPRPFTIEQLGMLLVLDHGDICFRNIRLEEVVVEVCRRVDCGTGDVAHIRKTSMRLDPVHVEFGAHQTLSISSQLSPSTVTSSSRHSVASHHRQSIDTSSSGTPTAIQSQTSTASSSSGSSPLANHQQPIALMSPDVSSDDAASTAGAEIADAIPWPSASKVNPAPSLPSEVSSAWAATIAYTRDLDKESFWRRHFLSPSSKANFHAALFWADRYRTTFKPANMELPPKPTNPGDLRCWQATCHRFFEAAEDIVVNAVLEKRGNPQGVGQGLGPVCRHLRHLKRTLLTEVGLAPKSKLSWSGDIPDTILWPSMSTTTPAPSLPREMSSAGAATVAHTRSLEDTKLWDWQGLTKIDRDTIYNALFWVRQYTTEWGPPGMLLPPKPANSNGFRDWQASCYRFFKAAENRIVKAMLEKQGVVDDVDEGSAGINRAARVLRRRVMDLGLRINPERKPYKRTKRS